MIPMHPRKRLEQIAAEYRQIIVDSAAWSDLHPGETPLDVEDCRVLLALTVKAIGAWDRYGSKSSEFSGAVNKLTEAGISYASSEAL